MKNLKYINIILGLVFTTSAFAGGGWPQPKGKTYLKDDVFITLQVYTTKEKSLNDEMDDFLNSFKIKF